MGGAQSPLPLRGRPTGGNQMSHYRKKPVVIEAVQWSGMNLSEIIRFTDPGSDQSTHVGLRWEDYESLVALEGLKIYTLEGKMNASVGDWIIKGVKGEFYPCKPDIFSATYEPASAPTGENPHPNCR